MPSPHNSRTCAVFSIAMLGMLGVDPIARVCLVFVSWSWKKHMFGFFVALVICSFTDENVTQIRDILRRTKERTVLPGVHHLKAEASRLGGAQGKCSHRTWSFPSTGHVPSLGTGQTWPGNSAPCKPREQPVCRKIHRCMAFHVLIEMG